MTNQHTMRAIVKDRAEEGPVKFRESGTDFLVESVTAYDGLKKVAALMNRRLTNVFPIEYGAGNSFVPMLVAMERDEPFVDVDPCGRAVPRR